MADQNELEPELEGAEPEATTEPAAIFTASGDVADAIHAELEKQQATIQSKVDAEIEQLELTSAYQQYLADEDKQNTPAERTNFLFEYVPTQPGTKTQDKKKIADLGDTLHDFSREIYSSIHNDPKFKNGIHQIQWGANNQESQSFSIGSQTIESVNGKADKMPFRNIDIPATITTDDAPLYLAFAARDSTNQNMYNPAFYFEVKYNSDGKLAGMMYPTPIKFSAEKPNIAYVEDKGQKYTLPITKQQFDALEQSLNQNQSRSQDQIIQRGTSSPEIKANKSYKPPTAEELQEAKRNLRTTKTTDRNQGHKQSAAEELRIAKKNLKKIKKTDRNQPLTTKKLSEAQEKLKNLKPIPPRDPLSTKDDLSSQLKKAFQQVKSEHGTIRASKVAPAYDALSKNNKASVGVKQAHKAGPQELSSADPAPSSTTQYKSPKTKTHLKNTEKTTSHKKASPTTHPKPPTKENKVVSTDPNDVDISKGPPPMLSDVDGWTKWNKSNGVSVLANPENLDSVKQSKVKKSEMELVELLMHDHKAPNKIVHQALKKPLGTALKSGNGLQNTRTNAKAKATSNGLQNTRTNAKARGAQK